MYSVIHKHILLLIFGQKCLIKFHLGLSVFAATIKPETQFWLHVSLLLLAELNLFKLVGFQTTTLLSRVGVKNWIQVCLCWPGLYIPS